MPHLSRPHIKLRPTRLDNIVEWTGRLLLAGMWALAAYAYLTLPDVIATHFDFSGRADAQGSKASLWMLPVIATVIYLGLTWLSSYPHVFNYPTPVTEHNAVRQYSIAVRLLRWLKLVIVAVFSLIPAFAVRAGGSAAARLPAWLLPLEVIMILTPVIIAVAQMLRQRDRL